MRTWEEDMGGEVLAARTQGLHVQLHLHLRRVLHRHLLSAIVERLQGCERGDRGEIGERAGREEEDRGKSQPYCAQSVQRVWREKWHGMA